MPNDLPVTVIGGYLGAGKTSLVNGLLRQAGHTGRPGPKLAVLVNDFGDIAIDADLIQGEQAGVIQLAGGCVCCTIGSDLISTLVTLPEKVGQPDHVLLETSGVAMPGTVAATVGLAQGVRRDGVIVLADALNLTRQRRDPYIADTIERQLAAADLIVLTKTDLIETDEAKRLVQGLSEEFSNASVLVASNGNLPLEIALDLPLNSNPGSMAITGKFQPGTDATDRYVSATYLASDPVDLDLVNQVLTNGANAIIRAKGFINSADGQQYLVQAVGARVDTQETRRLGGAEPNSRLVIIGLRKLLHPGAIDPLMLAAGFRRQD